MSKRHRTKPLAPPTKDRDFAAVWGVCFLDLMGYQQALMATDGMPKDEDEIHRRFTRVVERRRILVEAPEQYFRRVDKRGPIDPGVGEMSEHMRSVDVRVTGFSDNVFFETPLGANRFNPMVPLNAIVAASLISLFLNLSLESPVRGGIDIGFGLRSNGQLYSSAVVRAVALEKCAKYPRILIGEICIKYLRVAASGAKPAEAATARRILDLLFTDPDDGLQGIDFLGAVSQTHYASLFKPSDVRAIWLFAQNSRNVFNRPETKKERDYYDRLIKYMEPRLELWGIAKSLN